MGIIPRIVRPYSHYSNCPAFQWINQTLREIDEGSSFRAATRVSDALLEIHRTQGDPWEIIGREFSSKRGKASDNIEFDSPKSSSGSAV